MEDVLSLLNRIAENMEKVIIDKRGAIDLCITALLCGGHVLIEDVPGVGKTSLAGALAKSLNCSFKRIQFTPDIMPSDVTGFSAYSPKTGDFEYRRGAVLSNVVLADEINRASPKTQSSLLEAMEEKQVTVDGMTYKAPEPFIVLATQNPVEHLGTYPLPEAQMDRFLMRISIGYPGKREEMRITARYGRENPLASLRPVVDAGDIMDLRKITESIHVDARVNEYIIDIVRHTRENELVELGASPRASIGLFKAAQATALMDGRNYVIPDDVVEMSEHVLAHRIVLKRESKLRGVSQTDIVKMAVSGTAVPK